METAFAIIEWLLGLLMEPKKGFWEYVGTVTSVLVNVSVLAAAVAAAIKFRVLGMWKRRYRSEALCKHYVLRNGPVIFEGHYTIYNIGERPMRIKSVTLRLHSATLEGTRLVANRRALLAERVHKDEDEDADERGLFEIEAGARSIFPLRCELSELPGVVFLVCTFIWNEGRTPGFFSLYVRPDFTKSTTDRP